MTYGYSVEFGGVGGGGLGDTGKPLTQPWPAVPQAGDWYGPGPQTQVAIFTRMEEAGRGVKGREGAEGGPGLGAEDGGGAMDLLWSSTQ